MELSAFRGNWRIDRRVENAVGPDATFTGTARFDGAGDQLWQIEEGLMQMSGVAPLRAERRYEWRAAGAGIDVFFDDGRFFHHIAPGAAPQADHDCPPDVYQVRYDFSRWPEWSAHWRVQGPRKDYVMVSQYFRMDHPA